jgi:hypothetical protein
VARKLRAVPDFRARETRSVKRDRKLNRDQRAGPDFFMFT